MHTNNPRTAAFPTFSSSQHFLTRFFSGSGRAWSREFVYATAIAVSNIMLRAADAAFAAPSEGRHRRQQLR